MIRGRVLGPYETLQVMRNIVECLEYLEKGQTFHFQEALKVNGYPFKAACDELNIHRTRAALSDALDLLSLARDAYDLHVANEQARWREPKP
jgi:hypothetical protein